jgi:hypothetical protein
VHFAFLMAAMSAYVECPVLPGSSALFDPPRAKVIWVGETHGSTEEPQLFGDLVCAASASRRPVVVALERAAVEQPAWDAFLSSNGGPASEAALLSAWSPARDGRSSLAMLLLAPRLRRLKAEGRIVAVRMVVPDWTKLPREQFAERYEAQMAGAVAEAESIAPNALVVVYSGSAHAKKDFVTGGAERYRSAAAHLPAAEVVSVLVRSGPGTAWFCEDDDCGPHDFPSPAGGEHRRGVVVAAGEEGVDATAYTGTGTTVSPPAPGS